MKLYLMSFFFFWSINLFAQNDSLIEAKKFIEPSKSENVSIITLIASPEKYYGKRVSITGYLSWVFEGSAIFLSREDYDNRITKNAVYILGGENDYKHFHKEYVTLDGIFIKGYGHMGLYSGMLKDINYIRKTK